LIDELQIASDEYVEPSRLIRYEPTKKIALLVVDKRLPESRAILEPEEHAREKGGPGERRDERSGRGPQMVRPIGNRASLSAECPKHRTD